MSVVCFLLEAEEENRQFKKQISSAVTGSIDRMPGQVTSAGFHAEPLGEASRTVFLQKMC